MKRASGILLPVFSLPSEYGIGCFSKEAYEFVDMLKRAGQSVLADPAAWTDWLRGFPVPVFLHICRQSVLYRSARPYSGGTSDRRRVQGI